MSYKIPRNGFDNVKLTPAQGLLVKTILGAEKIFKFWKYPMKHDPDDQSLKNGIYWLHKSKYPQRRAEKGTDIEAYFQKNQPRLYSDYLTKSLPEGFVPKEQVKLSFIGDLMNAPGIENSRDRYFDKVESQVFDADISIANLESTLTKTKIEKTVFEKEKMPKINATLDQYNAITRHKNKKFTVFHTANNHVLDNGFEGFNTTHDQLEKEEFLYFGTNRTAKDQSTGTIIEKNGVKIGLIGWTYSLNLREFPPGHEYLVNSLPFHNLDEIIDLSPIQTQIENLKQKNVDFIIISIHWGMEYEFYPKAKQIRQAHEICELGADLIISHHAHCIQPTEFYTPKRDPNRVIPIIYGLGNFTSIFTVPHMALNLISNFTLSKGSVEGKPQTFVDSLRLTPIFQLEHISEEGNYLTTELLTEHKDRSHSEEWLEKDVALMCEYATQILGSGWLK